MSSYIKFIGLSFLVLLFSSQVWAQKQKKPNFSEGTITYKVEVEGLPEMAAFVNGTEFQLSFKEELSKMDIGIMNGFANFQFISNIKEKLYTLLVDVPTFYEKTAVPIDTEHEFFKQMQEKQANQSPAEKLAPEIEYNKKNKKRIARYRCHSAEVDMGGSDRMTVYLTNRLRPVAQSELQRQLGQMDGFPLGFDMRMNGMRISIMATKVKKEKLDNAHFEVPENYDEKTMDEVQKELKEKFDMDESTIGL